MQSKIYYEIIQPTYGLDIVVRLFRDKGSVVPDHYHDALELVFVLEREGLMMADGKLMVAGADQMLLVNPWVVHHSSAPLGNTNIMMQFPTALLNRMITDAGELEILNPSQITMSPEQQSAWLRIVEIMHAIIPALQDSAQRNAALRINLCAMEVLDILFSHFSTPQKPNAYKMQRLEKLTSVLDYIEAHYAEPITIEEVAAVASLQPEYFCRFFKKCTGSTFLEHLNALRITYIYNDLVNTDLQILDITEKHGLTNYKVFNRMFKARFGDTARGVRARIRGGAVKGTSWSEYNTRKFEDNGGCWEKRVRTEQITP